LERRCSSGGAYARFRSTESFHATSTTPLKPLSTCARTVRSMASMSATLVWPRAAVALSNAVKNRSVRRSIVSQTTVLAIAPPHFSDRRGEQFLQHHPIEIGQPLEVQTGLAHLMRAEPGE